MMSWCQVHSPLGESLSLALVFVTIYIFWWKLLTRELVRPQQILLTRPQMARSGWLSVIKWGWAGMRHHCHHFMTRLEVRCSHRWSISASLGMRTGLPSPHCPCQGRPSTSNPSYHPIFSHDISICSHMKHLHLIDAFHNIPVVKISQNNSKICLPPQTQSCPPLF